MSTRHTSPWLFASTALLALGTALGLAKVWTIVHGGFGSGDVLPFAVWTLPFALCLASVGSLLRTTARPRKPLPRLLAATTVGGLSGLAWTCAMAWAMGPWFGTMSFPVLWILMGAGGVSLLLAEIRERFRRPPQ